MTKKPSRLRAWRERHFLVADAIIAIVIGVAAIGVTFYRNASVDVARLLDGNRAVAYGTVATIYASLLGFILTAVSIVLLIGGLPRFKTLRNSGQYGAVFETFFFAVYVLAIGIVVSLIGFVLDHDNGGGASVVIESASFVLLCLCAAATLRCVILLRSISLIAATPLPETQQDS
jgi:hypothetical protein